MAYIDVLRTDTKLINLLGEPNAHMIWALGLYLENQDLESLASEALTDGPDDKKIDFILYDQDSKRIVFAQGFYGEAKRDSAPANKASDLNTATAWLLSGSIDEVPSQLKSIIEECRAAIEEGEVEFIDLLYVHNYPESVNVERELQTAASHLRSTLGEESPIIVSTKELGRSKIEHLFASQESQIIVKDEIICPAKPTLTQKGPNWESSVFSVPGAWLHNLFTKYGESLFSANYRGFLGISKRRRINTAIRLSAESKPKDFWAFNNGITILTLSLTPQKDGTRLHGVSIINGAQTTGSIGSVDLSKHDLKDVQVLCRIVQCSDSDTINDIIKFNNTQNEITTWDQYSNDPDQSRIEEEFNELGHSYIRKRGLPAKSDQIGIEEVAQPLVSFHGRFRDANRGKNQVFLSKGLYKNAFEGKKARHILFVYTLTRAIDEKRIFLKNKSNNGTIIQVEENQLALLRNIRFKYFFITVVAKVLESIIGNRVVPETIAFSPEASNSRINSLLSLIAAWTPIVDTVLTFTATQVNASELTEQVKDENIIDNISRHVNSMVYATRENLPISDFTRLVSSS